MSKRSKTHRRSGSAPIDAGSVTRARKNPPNTVNRTFLDDIDFSLPYEDKLPTSTQRLVNTDGEITYQAQNRMEFPGRFNVAAYRVRTIQGRELRCQVCPPKVQYGHNAAGRGSLRPVVRDVIDFVGGKLRVHLELGRLERPRPQSVKIYSVSLVRHLRFDDTNQAAAAVDEISRRCQDRALHVLFQKQGETVTAGRNRKVATATFYVKAKEMQQHPTMQRTPDSQAVQAAVSGWLRVEIRVTAATLRKRGLHTVGGWHARTADALFDSLFQEFAFLDLIPVSVTAPQPDSSLTPSLRRAVTLARLGEDLRSHFSAKHVRSLVKSAAELGVDLRSVSTSDKRALPWISLSDRWVTDVPADVKMIRGFKEQFAPGD